jgi:hypothetical protein
MRRGFHSSNVFPSLFEIADSSDCVLWKTRSHHPFG